MAMGWTPSGRKVSEGVGHTPLPAPRCLGWWVCTLGSAATPRSGRKTWKPERGFQVAGLLPLDRACWVSRALIHACSETFMLFSGLGELPSSGPNSCQGRGMESGELGGGPGAG